MINPFDPAIDQEVLHHMSGTEASESISTDIKEARERGENAFLEFCAKRLQSDDISIHQPLKKMKLKTFRDVSTTTVSKSKGREIALKADCNLFARLIVIGTSRKVDMSEMLVHCLGPLPAALAHYDVSLMKIDKSKLMHFLVAMVNPPAAVSSIPDSSTWVWDGMALVQVMKAHPTFGMFADSLLRLMVSVAAANKSKVVHFVADPFQSLSIKNAERERRAGKGGYHLTKIYAEDQRTLKQWSKFLACGQNKDNLIDFFFKRWSQSGGHIMEDLTLIIAYGEQCHALKKNTRYN